MSWEANTSAGLATIAGKPNEMKFKILQPGTVTFKVIPQTKDIGTPPVKHFLPVVIQINDEKLTRWTVPVKTPEEHGVVEYRGT